MSGHVHDRLKVLMDHLRLSLREFSHEAGIPYAEMQDYASGKTIPSTEHLLNIRSIFGASIDWLLTGEGAMMASGPDVQPATYGKCAVTQKIVRLLQTMDENGRRDVLAFVEKEKVLPETIRKKKEEK